MYVSSITIPPKPRRLHRPTPVVNVGRLQSLVYELERLPPVLDRLYVPGILSRHGWPDATPLVLVAGSPQLRNITLRQTVYRVYGTLVTLKHLVGAGAYE